MGFSKADFLEANAIAGTKLSGQREINSDHVSELGITTDRLAIGQEQDGLSAWRNLDRAGCDSLRDEIGVPLSELQMGTLETDAHAIGVG